MTLYAGGAIDNKECNILSDLLRIIPNFQKQCDRAKGVHFCSFKLDKWSVGWN